MIAKGYEFNKIIEDIFTESSKIEIIKSENIGHDKGYDFIIKYDGQNYVVEVKSITASFSKMQLRYNSIMQKLNVPNGYKKLLVLATYESEEFIDKELANGYTVWTLNKLTNVISEITETEIRKNLFEKLDNFAKENLNISIQKIKNSDNSKLLQEYNSIKKGAKGKIALRFEEICRNIIEAVFMDDIANKPQKLKNKNEKI